MRKSQVLSTFIVIAFFVLNTGWAFAGEREAQGQPFQYLKQQIDDLKEQIRTIQSTSGLQGPPGTACWDSNENGVCDPTTEDANVDETCDVKDCQASSNNASIRVYDSSTTPQY
jgi:hypothetical protein